MPGKTENFWDGLDYDLFKSEAQGQAPKPKKPKKPAFSKKDKATIVSIDLILCLVWIYFLIKVFFIDIDERVLSAISPSLLPLLEYRGFFYLGLLATLAIFFKRYWFYLIYFLIIPAKVLIWYPGKIVYKLRSGVALVLALNSIADMLSSLRYHTISKSLFLISAAILLISEEVSLLWASAILLMLLFAVSVYKVFKRFIANTSFLKAQQAIIDKFINSKIVKSMIALDKKYVGKRAKDLQKAEVTSIANSLQLAIAVNKILTLWAYQLEKYKKSLASQVLVFLPYLALIFNAAITFSLVNFALYKLNADNFTYENQPSLIHFLYYSFVGLLGFGEIEGLRPQSNLAITLKIVVGLVGVVVIATLLLNVFMAWKKQRDDSEIEKQIAALKDQQVQMEVGLIRDFGVSSIKEAVTILRKTINTAMIDFIDKLMPDNPQSKKK